MSLKDIALFNGYDYESFSVATGAVNEDVTPTNQPMLIIGSVNIDSDQPITVRFNNASEPAIPLALVDMPLALAGLAIGSILVSNSSGSTATVKVTVTGNKAPA
jgi:hypothetical protein